MPRKTKPDYSSPAIIRCRLCDWIVNARHTTGISYCRCGKQAIQTMDDGGTVFLGLNYQRVIMKGDRYEE